MNDIAIRVEGLSKQYRIGGPQAQYKTIRESIVRGISGPIEKASKLLRGESYGAAGLDEKIWALRDVSFDIGRGEVVGIIGRNGAGKTTLLKVLSRITKPDTGCARIFGRVGSLLEVGTGFHPELTGRENIYLNGSILGMRKTEIDRKFDEIVEFAGISKFIETPVKHYSSGMYVRLAFSVAAHLELENLLVDEVLSVGDVAFQRKSLGKMENVAQEGRTILFVSHQLNQIRRLTARCVWLDDGVVRMYGPTVDVVSAYEAAMSNAHQERHDAADRQTHRFGARFLSWKIIEPRDEKPNYLTTLDTCVFGTVVQVNSPVEYGRIGIVLYNNDSQLMCAWRLDDVQLPIGRSQITMAMPTLPIRPGVYHWQVSLYDQGKLQDKWFCVPEMIVATEPITHPNDKWTGVLNLPSDIRIEHMGLASN